MKTYTADDFRILCAWCQSEIRAPRRLSLEAPPESHGVCRCCAINMGLPPHLITQDSNLSAVA